LKTLEVTALPRSTDSSEWKSEVLKADAVVHLAGVNRPQDQTEFISGNCGTTKPSLIPLADTARRIPVIYASSTRAAEDSPYGEVRRLPRHPFALTHANWRKRFDISAAKRIRQMESPQLQFGHRHFLPQRGEEFSIQVHDPAHD